MDTIPFPFSADEETEAESSWPNITQLLSDKAGPKANSRISFPVTGRKAFFTKALQPVGSVSSVRDPNSREEISQAALCLRLTGEGRCIPEKRL